MITPKTRAREHREGKIARRCGEKKGNRILFFPDAGRNDTFWFFLLLLETELNSA
jgi:hypothetical protein